MLKQLKDKVNNDPKLFMEAPLTILALNFMTIGGYLVFDAEYIFGFALMTFASVIIIIQKYLEKRKQEEDLHKMQEKEIKG